MEGERIFTDEHAVQLCQLFHWQQATVGLDFSPVRSTFFFFFFWPVLTSPEMGSWFPIYCCQTADTSCLHELHWMCCSSSLSVPIWEQKCRKQNKEDWKKRWLDLLAEALRSVYTNINTWDAAGERAWLYWYIGKNAGLYFKCGKQRGESSSTHRLVMLFPFCSDPGGHRTQPENRQP